MADAVTSTILHSGEDMYVISLTNRSDGTGENAVAKVNLATIFNMEGLPAVRAGIEEVQFSIQGFNSVQLLWDHTADDTAMQLAAGNGYREFRTTAPLMDPQSAGGSGNLLLTTFGAAVNATYDILMLMTVRFR